MNKLSNAEIALLGLLTEQSMHPYLIEQEVKHRDMRYWTDLSMSSKYKLLIKLEKEGFITSSNQVSAENRLQKVYSINEKGENAIQQKIEDLLCTPEHIRWSIDIGIYNSNLLTPEKIYSALSKYREELQNKIKGYQELLEYLIQSKCPKHRFELANRPVFLFKAEIEWIDSYLPQLNSKSNIGAPK